MSRRSRLNKHLEKQSKRTLFLSIVGIFLIGLALLKFGIPLIADLGFLSSQIVPKNETKKSDTEDIFLSPPSIDPLPSATNVEGIEVSGTSTTGKNVVIYLNGSRYGAPEIDSDGNFSLSVKLSEGINIIKAKAIEEKNESEFSDSISIDFRKNPPDLTIELPSDGQTTNKSPFLVTGKTETGVKVTINDFWAIVNSKGNFSYNLALRGGENEIKVVATDEAGNKTEKSVKLNYSP